VQVLQEPGTKCGENVRSTRELGAILRISAPLAAAYLAEIAMGITDLLIVGRLGSIELAGVGIASNVLFEIVIVAVGLVSIVAVLASEARGANDMQGVRHAVRQGFLVALFIGVPATLVALSLSPILAATGQDPEVVEFAGRYLHGAAWSILPYLLFVVLRCFLSALSLTGAIMVVTAVAIGVNAVATYGLVFGAFGLPALGVSGAGWATSLTVWMMFAALVVHTIVSRRFRSFRIYARGLRVDTAVCKEIFRLGTPIAGIALLESGMFVAVAVFMGVLGAPWLAANQIVFNVIGVGFMIALAVGEATGVRVAYGVGARDERAVRASALTGIATGIVVMLVSASLLWLFPREIVSAFLDVEDPANAVVVEYAVVLAGIAAVFQLFDGLQAVASRALRGLKDTLVPMWLASIGYWVLGIGGGLMLCFVLGYGARGLWWGLALGLTVTALALMWRLDARTRL